MSKNHKKSLTGQDVLVAMAANNNNWDAAKIDLETKKVERIMAAEVINMVVAELEAMPEVGLMAQLVAVEEEAKKAIKAAKAQQQAKAEAEKRMQVLQRDLLDTEINTRLAIISRRGIADLQARFGQFFQKKVAQMVEQAKLMDEEYQAKQEELKRQMKAAQEAEKSMKALTKTARAHERNHTKIEKELNALLSKEA